jgi:hypothetical protein
MKERALRFIYRQRKGSEFMKSLFVFFFLALSFTPLRAEDEAEEAPEIPSAIEQLRIEPEGEDSKQENVSILKSAGPTLNVGSRFDANFSGGGAVAQGFAIPSARLSVYGDAGEYIKYRFSLGQTREFSSALLPQMLPVEAYVDAGTQKSEGDGTASLRVRFGLFAPQFNPWWTPDLGDIRMSDYHETHKALFLSREMGVEVLFAPFHEWLELAVAYVNGSGIFAENTNNAKTFTAFAKFSADLNVLRLSLGAGAFILNQSMKGSVNFKTNSATDVFLELALPDNRTKLQVDGFVSRYEDATRGLSPSGGALALHLGLTSWASLFGRYESATGNPIVAGRIRQFQIGPIFDLTRSLTTYVDYAHRESGGAKENIFEVRARLTI